MNRISLASGVMPDIPASEVIWAAEEGGFDMVGLWVEPGEWSAADTREARAILAATKLPVLDVEVIWLRPDRTLDDQRIVLDVGAELGAANALCVSSLPDAGETAAQLRALCEHAEGSGMRGALECGLFTEVRDGAAAMDVIGAVDHPLAALLVDPIHVDRSGTPLDLIRSADPHLLPYAQFCDAPAARPALDDMDAILTDALDLREQCGEGALPLRELYAALPGDIPLSIELRSRALREAFPDLGERAKAVAQATRRWLQTQAVTEAAR